MNRQSPQCELDYKLNSVDKQSTILFSFLELETERYPSISYRIEVNDYAFKGSINIWFELSSLQDFLDNLIELNRTRLGESTLKSMSPEEFELSITSIRKDRFIIEYSMKKTRYSIDNLVKTKLSGLFEFDSEYFNKIEEDISRIMKVIQA